ncbi:DedA family protein [bacterium]|nr:MAG: DedA family protein [bacterium]
MTNLLIVASTGGLSERIPEWVVTVMQALGEPGAGLLIALENLFPPLPSEVILPLAGFAASQGTLSLPGAIIWTTLGSVAGAVILYYAGALLGRERLRAIAKKLPLVKISDIDKTEAWFIKHETKAVFWGRMIPIFRSLISIPAGVERMRMSTFLLLTTLGSLIWNTIFILAGYTLGENWHIVERYAELFQYLVIATIGLAAIYFILVRLNHHRTKP